MPLLLSDGFREILENARSIAGNCFGLRPYTVEMIVRTSSGAEAGDGTVTETVTVIEENGSPPKVRWLNEEELAIAQAGSSQIQIGPITPPYNGGSQGTAFSLLAPQPGSANSGTVKIRITGPETPFGGMWRPLRYKTDSALHYMVVAERASTS